MSLRIVDRETNAARQKEKFEKILGELERESIHIDDRRQRRSVFAVQAYAALCGSREVATDDLEIAQHCLWVEHGQQQTVAHIVARIAEPVGMQAHRLQMTAEAILKATDTHRFTEALKAVTKLTKLDELFGRLKRTIRVTQAHEQLKVQLRRMRQASSHLNDSDDE